MPTPKEYVATDGTRTWRVRFRHGTKATSETFHTLREAEAFCADLKHHDADYAVRLRDQDDTLRTSPSLDEVAALFFTWKEPRAKSDRTVADYRRDYRNAISPTLGRRPVAAIVDIDVQQLIDGWVSGTIAPRIIKGKPRPLSAKSISDRHALLHQILEWATTASGGRLITTNPVKGTSTPTRRKAAPKGLRPAEWDALHRALTALSPDAGDLAWFLLASGWRWSEATALDAWGVDDDGTLVRCVMGRVVRRNAAGEHVIVEDDGKRDASLRRVRLDPEASAMVRARIQRQGMGLVFRTPISPQNGLGGNQWHYSNFVARYWRPAVALANLSRKPTPHWLRHTHVAFMSASGANLAELSSRIGHASIKTTIDVYGRLLSDVSDTALGGFAAMRDAAELAAPQVVAGEIERPTA